MNFFKFFFKKSEIKKSDSYFVPNDIQIETNKTSQNPEWDEVFDAWTSDNLEKMLKVTNLKTSLLNRHFLLQSIVNKSYKLREQEYYKNLCLEYAEIHISEFEKIAPVLKKDMDGILPQVSTFQNCATLLTEIGEYEKAISVCEVAISYELDDGTKSNYEGRIERIKKKM